MLTKKCGKCNKNKNIDNFTKDKNKKDGYSYWCKDCRKTYLQNNKIEIAMQCKAYRRENKNKLEKQRKKYLTNKPWIRKYIIAKQRCTNPNNASYKWYGGRGIKCKITSEEIRYLWFRDKAYNMKKPSIDRKDNDGNYILENCRFIEFSENSIKRHKRRNK